MAALAEERDTSAAGSNSSREPSQTRIVRRARAPSTDRAIDVVVNGVAGGWSQVREAAR